MLILWIFVGSALLFFLQRWLFQTYWSRGLRLTLRFGSAAVTEGEKAAVTERIENRKWLPLPLLSYCYTLSRNFAAVTETGAKPIVLRRKLAMPMRRAAVNRTTIEGLPRGLYTVIEARVSAGDLFFTASWERELHCGARLTVYPAKLPARKLALPFRQLLGAVLTRRMAQEDPFQLKGIRQYEIYDSLRTVNWKASAKTGELKVNQYEYSTDEAIAFLLDAGSGSEEEREELIRLASSLSQLFLRHGVSVSLQSNGRSCVTGAAVRVPAGSGIGHQTVLDSALAQIKLGAFVTLPFEGLLSEAAAVPARALPVVLSAGRSDAVAAACKAAFGPGGAYVITLGEGGSSARSGVRILSWDPAGEEASA